MKGNKVIGVPIKINVSGFPGEKRDDERCNFYEMEGKLGGVTSNKNLLYYPEV